MKWVESYARNIHPTLFLYLEEMVEEMFDERDQEPDHWLAMIVKFGNRIDGYWFHAEMGDMAENQGMRQFDTLNEARKWVMEQF